MPKYKILGFKGEEMTEAEVDGEPVHFAGYEDFRFFSHRCMDGDKWGSYETFHVSEVTSGVKIGSGLSLEEAISVTSTRLAKDTPEGLQDKINRFLEMKKQLKDGN